MSLGWGLRGSIGGGSLGAMIPGAMIGLVLCVLLNRHSDSGLIAAFAAIGVGFGGQETYGQTVGLSLQPETFWWAILGFVVKGAAWGLLGGAFIGIALDRGRHATAQLLAGFAIMVLGTWIGWQFSTIRSWSTSPTASTGRAKSSGPDSGWAGCCCLAGSGRGGERAVAITRCPPPRQVMRPSPSLFL